MRLTAFIEHMKHPSHLCTIHSTNDAHKTEKHLRRKKFDFAYTAEWLRHMCNKTKMKKH